MSPMSFIISQVRKSENTSKIILEKIGIMFFNTFMHSNPTQTLKTTKLKVNKINHTAGYTLS